MTDPLQFRFLNETGDLAVEGWDHPAREKLWRYNLHYFDDLNARDSEVRDAWHTALLAKWIRENPPGQGTGWEPYPTSRRIVNWIKWSLRQGVEVTPEMLDSLATQTRWLSRRLETHILGNHLFANAKALVLAGLFFEGEEAETWLERGLDILAREIPEQILPDGGHFERSPMYHAIILEDLLDLFNLLRAYPDTLSPSWRTTVERWRDVVAPVRTWLQAMSHPDGDIGFFNDAAIGIAPPPAELDRYARHLGFPDHRVTGEGITHLVQSGYIRLERGPAVAILDVAPVGPDYLPGHAHADTLSFELSLFGQRVLVNSGTSCYGTSPERLRQRGTAAHNTVLLDGVDSSEVWSGFRVARRARPAGLAMSDGATSVVRCGHDGYERLPGRPRHTRRWSLRESALLVEDELTGQYRHARAHFHLHPSIRIAQMERVAGATMLRLVLPKGHEVLLTAKGGTISQEPTTWHPAFGAAQPCVCLVLEPEESVFQTELAWNSPP